MSNYVIDQLRFVRRQAVNYVDSISDSTAEIIPEVRFPTCWGRNQISG